MSHDGWESRCPGHRSSDHSLSITRNEHSHVVLECPGISTAHTRASSVHSVSPTISSTQTPPIGWSASYSGLLSSPRCSPQSTTLRMRTGPARLWPSGEINRPGFRRLSVTDSKPTLKKRHARPANHRNPETSRDRQVRLTSRRKRKAHGGQFPAIRICTSIQTLRWRRLEASRAQTAQNRGAFSHPRPRDSRA